MNTNESKTDRIIRAVAGAICAILAFTLHGVWTWIFGIVAIILLATAAVGFCPLYRLFGVNTCPINKSTPRVK